LDTTTSIRDELPDPKGTILEAEIWKHDSNELCDLAETIVNRHPRFAWMIVEAWLTKHDQVVINK